jgi:hypothetical protein
MLFLANMLSKMKHNTPLGSRIAEVHNGSSLFAGDAGGGESNVRRWIHRERLAGSHRRPCRSTCSTTPALRHIIENYAQIVERKDTKTGKVKRDQL